MGASQEEVLESCQQEHAHWSPQHPPWEVREAKEIRRLIIERTEGARGSPSETFYFTREYDGSVGKEDTIGTVYGNECQGAGEGGGAAASAR